MHSSSPNIYKEMNKDSNLNGLNAAKFGIYLAVYL